MTSTKFIIYQFFISLLRGFTSLFILYFFSNIYNSIDLARTVILWSLGDMVSVFLFMSSITIAPQIFFKSSKYNSDSLERASYYQLFRFILFIITTILVSLYIYTFHYHYKTILFFILFQNLVAILPTWKYYSNRNLGKVLFVEAILKMPIILCISINLLFNYKLDLFNLFAILNIILLFYILYDIKKYFKVTKFNNKYFDFTLSYFYSIYKINFTTMLFNSGQVYLISFVAPITIINQLAIIDKIKNLYLQIIGVFLGERVSKNRDLINGVSIFSITDYLMNNIKVVIINFVILIIMLSSYYTNIYKYIFNIDIDTFSILLLPMFYVFLHCNTILFISHILNPMGKLTLFKSIYVNCSIVTILIAILLLTMTNYTYLVIIAAGSIQNILILLFGFYYIKKDYVNNY